MTPFALVFMIVSMVAVTVLAGYTLTRTMRAKPPAAPDDEPPAG